VFVFGSSVARWGNLGFAGFCVLIAAGSLTLQPPSISAFIVWGGLGAYLVYDWYRRKASVVTSISFYDDRMETSGSHPGVYRFADIASVYVSGISKWGKVIFKGEDQIVWLGVKPKSSRADVFYDWFQKRLEPFGVLINLPPGGVGKGDSGPLVILSMVPIAIYVVLSVALVPFESVGQLLALGMSLLTFLFVAYRIAKKEDARTEPHGKQPVWVDLWRRVLGGGARWVPGIILLEVAGTIAISLLPFFTGESSYFLQLIQHERQTIGTAVLTQFMAIFSNNLRVLVFSFVPVWGPLSLAGSTYNTARVVEAITQNASYPLPNYLFYAFSFPHTWLELTAYAIGIFQSVKLPYSWAPSRQMGNRRNLLSYVREVIVVMGFAVSVLAIAGIFEALEPHMADPYLLWIPTIGIFGIPIALWVRLRPHANPTQDKVFPADAK
jgi:uncharacterized membrane protein SpoIIM required for sporulation